MPSGMRNMEARAERIKHVLEAIKAFGEKGVHEDDLYSEISLQWGLRKALFREYVDGLVPRHVIRDRGGMLYYVEAKKML